MAKIVSKAGFKPMALEYFRLVEETGIDLVITDRGRPVVKITPYVPREKLQRRCADPCFATKVPRNPSQSKPGKRGNDRA